VTVSLSALAMAALTRKAAKSQTDAETLAAGGILEVVKAAVQDFQSETEALFPAFLEKATDEEKLAHALSVKAIAER
jgi:hypothetical protein